MKSLKNLSNIEKRLDRFSPYLIWVVFIIFAVLYSILSIVRHMHYQSGAFDLGIYDQGVWQYAHFLFPYNTIKMRMILGDHLTLTLPLLAPLFYLWNDARMLLIFQAVWISFSSLGIFKYLTVRKFTSTQALVLSVLYLLFYGIQFGVFFDFHPVIIGVGIAAWVLYFWESGKWKWFATSVAFLLLTQENMGMVLFALSILWFFQGKRRKLAIVLGVIGLIDTFIAFRLVNAFSDVGLEYVPHISHNPVQIVKDLFNAPEKQQVWLYSYTWFSFLPLFSPGSLLAVLSDLAQYFVTGPDYARMWSPFMHHRAILSIYLLVGTADVLLFLKTRRLPITLVIFVMFFVAMFFQYHYHFALDKLAKKDFWQHETWIDDNNEMLTHVPQSASVAAQQSLVPHLSHREKIYLVYPRSHTFANKQVRCVHTYCWWLDWAGKPDLLVVDTHDNEWLTMTLEDITNFREAVSNMEKNQMITLQYQKGEARIYKINYNALATAK